MVFLAEELAGRPPRPKLCITAEQLRLGSYERKLAMEFTLNKHIKENDALRKSFFDLAVKTFDLCFVDWYQNGFWTDQYIPYALVDQNRVIANASVNIMRTIWQTKPRRYIQIGTVMTDAAYRKRGLSRRLITKILSDWKDQSDGIYLFANETVLDFYPKFGFQKAIEYQYAIPVTAGKGDFRKLNMEQESNRALLLQCYEKSNPFSRLPMIGNEGLLMFYCAGLMKNHVYYSEKHDTVCIAGHNNGTLQCFDIFGSPKASLETILSEISPSSTRQAVLGFTPNSTKHGSCSKIEGEDTLFVWKEKENIFVNQKMMFPLLSHA